MRLLTIGLDPPEHTALADRLDVPVLAHEVLPALRVDGPQLFSERPSWLGCDTQVDAVVYHGIFADDLAALAGLALWGGPCLPAARGMVDLRLRLPALLRALDVTRFPGPRRGFASAGVVVDPASPRVAKWSDWHCGDDKERITAAWRAPAAALVEPYVDGEALRIQLIGERAWQVRLTGDDWKRSIHPADAALVDVDADLLADTRALAAHFGLAVIGVDYIRPPSGDPVLLEVNHIPNVTRFPEMREAYLALVVDWVRGLLTA